MCNVAEVRPNDKINTTILDLNDDCFTEIFAHVSSCYDLYSLSKVCKRFRPIAQQLFPKRFKTIDLTDKRFEPFESDDWSDFFDCFGWCVIEMTIGPYSTCGDGKNSNKIYESIQESCKSLKHLKLTEVNIRGSMVKSLTAIFGKLYSLELRECINCTYAANINSMFEGCPYMESLTLMSNSNMPMSMFYRCIFVSLKVFISDDEFQQFYLQFFMFNKNMRYVSMQGLPFTILRNLRKLQSFRAVLDGYIDEADVRFLQTAENLKSVSLICGDVRSSRSNSSLTSIIKALGVRNQIETLELWGFESYTLDNDNEFNSVLTCTNLKALKIGPYCLLDDNKLTLITEHLPNLTKIFISAFNDVTSNKFLSFVENCPNLVELHMQNLKSGTKTKHSIYMHISRLHTICERRERFISIYTDKASIALINKYGNIYDCRLDKHLTFYERESHEPSFKGLEFM